MADCCFFISGVQWTSYFYLKLLFLTSASAQAWTELEHADDMTAILLHFNNVGIISPWLYPQSLVKLYHASSCQVSENSRTFPP